MVTRPPNEKERTMIDGFKDWPNYEVKLAKRYCDDAPKSIKEQAEAFELEHPIVGILG